MAKVFSKNAFYHELENSLLGSTAEQRKKWVTCILEGNLNIQDLSKLLFAEKKVAMRFAWLLSEVGMSNPNTLHKALPSLLKLSSQIKHFPFSESFANYWLIAGVPLENEATAIDYLFKWLISAQTNVTIKGRAMNVLVHLSNKYPELKTELKLIVMDQKTRYTSSFEKRVQKIINRL